MKTILCPVDFTGSSDRVSKYAAQLAADVQAKVVLLAAHPRETKIPAGDWPEDKSEVMDRLGEMHDLLTSEYHIPCAMEEEVIVNKVVKRLSTAADHFDIIMLGVQPGKNGSPVATTGLNLISMIQETLVPIFVVPDKFGYQKVNRLLYAFDYRHEPDPPLMTLHWLAEWFDAEVKFISILQSNTSMNEKDRIHEVQHNIDRQWQSGKKLLFETIVHDDVPRCLEQYVSIHGKNDLLVLSVNHQNIVERIWHKSVVKRMIKSIAHPYLIIHK